MLRVCGALTVYGMLRAGGRRPLAWWCGCHGVPVMVSLPCLVDSSVRFRVAVRMFCTRSYFTLQTLCFRTLNIVLCRC